MTDISNLTGLEKPLTKLLETLGNGLGVAGNTLFKFDEKKIRRISAAEAEAEKAMIIKKAEGEADALGILTRAISRNHLEQFTKQINLENVIIKTQDLLINEEVSSEPVDTDWTSRFIGVAQDVSKEQVQDVLAKILAGEIKQPSTYSLKTLDVIKNLTVDDLKSFQKFIALSTDGVGIMVKNSGSNDELSRYGLSFANFLHLADMDLFNSSSSITIELNIPKNTKNGWMKIADKSIKLNTSADDMRARVGLLKFTESGASIASLLSSQSSNSKKDIYIDNIKKLIVSKGFNLADNSPSIPNGTRGKQ